MGCPNGGGREPPKPRRRLREAPAQQPVQHCPMSPADRWEMGGRLVRVVGYAILCTSRRTNDSVSSLLNGKKIVYHLHHAALRRQVHQKLRVQKVGLVVAFDRSNLVKVPHQLPTDLKHHLFENDVYCRCLPGWVGFGVRRGYGRGVS